MLPIVYLVYRIFYRLNFFFFIDFSVNCSLLGRIEPANLKLMAWALLAELKSHFSAESRSWDLKPNPTNLWSTDYTTKPVLQFLVLSLVDPDDLNISEMMIVIMILPA